MVTILKESMNDKDIKRFYDKLEEMHRYIGKQLIQIRRSDFPDLTMKATIDKIEDFYGDLQGILVMYNK